MSFADQNGIMELIENLLRYSWPETITTPFKRMIYDDAMRLYGTDQPDLRIPYEVRKLHVQMHAYINFIFSITY